MLKKNSPESINEFINKALEVPFRDQGRDFSGWDCGGLIINAYHYCFGIDLPDMEGISALDNAQAARAFTSFSRTWQEISPGQEKVGDVALFRRGRWESHAGLVVGPGMVLHAEADLGITCIEPFNQGLLKPRLVGIYRHEQLAGSH